MASDVPTELLALQRLASVAQIGGFRPPSTPRSSWLGAVLLGAPGESWPESDGRPLAPACQILVEELPAAAPAPLADIALLTLFLDLPDMPENNAQHGDGWELRTYATVDDLVPVNAPEPGDAHPRPFPVLWRPRTELPRGTKSRTSCSTPGTSSMTTIPIPTCSTSTASKVGGWPRTIQSDIDWPAKDTEFVLQVDSDEKAQIAIVDPARPTSAGPRPPVGN